MRCKIGCVLPPIFPQLLLNRIQLSLYRKSEHLSINHPHLSYDWQYILTSWQTPTNNIISSTPRDILLDSEESMEITWSNWSIPMSHVASTNLLQPTHNPPNQHVSIPIVHSMRSIHPSRFNPKPPLSVPEILVYTASGQTSKTYLPAIEHEKLGSL